MEHISQLQSALRSSVLRSGVALDYNYCRDYNPQTGRYIESDLIGLRAGVNTYSYVSNDPLGLVDPFGTTERGGGQTSVGGNDPLIPSGINKNTPRDVVKSAIEAIEDAKKMNRT